MQPPCCLSAVSLLSPCCVPAVSLLSPSCLSAVSLFPCCLHFGTVLAPFWVRFWFHFGSILRFRGTLETPWGPFWPHLWPRSLKNAILVAFWAPLGRPFGSTRGQVLGSKIVLEGCKVHFGAIFGGFRRLSIFTSFLDTYTKKCDFLRCPMCLIYNE